MSSISVDGNLKQWQVNMLKSIVSLLQNDLQGENAFKRKMNEIPHENHPVGIFKANEVRQQKINLAYIDNKIK